MPQGHGVDALALELSEAPKDSNNLGAYRAAKERVLPLLAEARGRRRAGRGASRRGEQAQALHQTPAQSSASEMVAASSAE